MIIIQTLFYICVILGSIAAILNLLINMSMSTIVVRILERMAEMESVEMPVKQKKYIPGGPIAPAGDGLLDVKSTTVTS